MVENNLFLLSQPGFKKTKLFRTIWNYHRFLIIDVHLEYRGTGLLCSPIWKSNSTLQIDSSWPCICQHFASDRQCDILDRVPHQRSPRGCLLYTSDAADEHRDV